MGLFKCLWALCFLAAAAFPPAQANDGWRWGRATFYGIWWSIHTGSCGYGNIDYWQGTGWDVAAIPDSHYEYNWSCGKCYEVKCEPMNFKDNYGNHLDRSSSCYDPWKVVTVTIVDSCPCNYASNSYSNKRWCCGDMDHFDLSYHTFDKLADRKWGVIGLKYRPVACPASYLENKHHLGRRLQEEDKEGKEPEMLIVDERYERPEGHEGPLPIDPVLGSEESRHTASEELKEEVSDIMSSLSQYDDAQKVPYVGKMPALVTTGESLTASGIYSKKYLEDLQVLLAHKATGTKLA